MFLNFKKFLILIFLLSLTNCAAPGTALLSPAFTGIKTKSAHQASISFASSLGSNQLIKTHGEKVKKEVINRSKKIFEYLNNFHKIKI
mgnify:CR=1 FL=1|tara:strand:+ start:1671 stop:1934 length:264 start_codon:yes stop_codon:yes gene_type:complete